MTSNCFGALARTTTRLLLGAALASGCLMDSVPEPLKRTPPGPGATVVFDTERRPLPEVPLPNDIATFPDPTSRTGVRVNASLVASSSLEIEARAAFAEQEGWGTSMPISVAFARTPEMDARLPAIDLDELQRRTRADEHVFDDDPVYLIDLETGLPVPLSFGSGEFPLTLQDPMLYGPADPHARNNNLLVEENEEGKGLSQADYTPALDLDFDGVLDHPNVWPDDDARPILDRLLEVYERETDTLLLRPLLPLREKHEYAVVLTTRLLGQDRRPVRSPFDGVYHPAQLRAATRVQQILGDAERANYYGDLSGGGLDGVAFLWSFTTAPTVEDLRLLRDGLYGFGPFARLGRDFPPKASLFRAQGPASGKSESDPECVKRAGQPYTVDVGDPKFRDGIGQIVEQLFSYGPGSIDAINKSLDATAYLAIGEYTSPYLMGDPKARKKGDRFHLDFRTGEGPVSVDQPQFWASVPKPSAGHQEPYPVVLWAHGVGSNGVEALLYGGDFARHGLATVTVQMPLHGLPDLPIVRIFMQSQLNALCLSPLIDGVLKTRVLDLNGDTNGDVAHWWFTMHAATVRDNLRQAAVDYLQFARVLRTFDGVTMSGQDYNGDGVEDLAGDFNGNGVPDFGGPNVPIYIAGGSNGGIMTAILGAVGHEFTAGAVMSGGGGLIDVAARSYGIAGAVMQSLSPMIVGVPSRERPKQDNGARQTLCDDGATVRALYSDGPNAAEIELACLTGDELHSGQTVLVRNLDNHEVRCARTDDAGRFRIPIPSSQGDRLRVEIYEGADRVESYKGCALLEGATLTRAIDTFEQPEVYARPLASDNPGCPDEAERGCTRVYDRFIAVGEPLFAPQEGFGVERQTPDLRRLFQLAQGLLDPADPINFARHHFLEPLPTPLGTAGVAHPLIANATVGDGFVPVSTLQAFARAAGLLPMFRPSAPYPEYRDWITPVELYAEYNKTPERLLIDTYVTEGDPDFARHPVAREACGSGQREVEGLCGAPSRPSADVCRRTLYDVDWFSDGTDGYGAAHPSTPLRLVRRATPTSAGLDPDALWAPRTTPGGFREDVPLAALGHVYVTPTGAHTWLPADSCARFDDATWGNMLNGRFLSTRGHDVYYATHPAEQRCLADRSCDFEP